MCIRDSLNSIKEIYLYLLALMLSIDEKLMKINVILDCF